MEDLDISNGLAWFRQFVPRQELEDRMNKILEYLDAAIRPQKGHTTRITYEDDIFGWYLLLSELYISRSINYDFFQGSRVIPYFKAIGQQTRHLDAIKGIDRRAKRIVSKNGDHPDTGIFELLTAACYLRNGYHDVEFLPEGQERTPDIFATKKHDVYVECKRLTRISQYSINERERWCLLWEPVGRHIAHNKIPLFFKIIFKKELSELPDSFLENLLIPKINLIPTTCRTNPIDDDSIRIECHPINYKRIQKYLGNYYLRTNSPQYINIVLGEYEQFGNYRLIVQGQHNSDNPILVSEVNFAAGASWKSTAERSIDIKSRHIKKRLADAFKQIPSDKYGIIHLGVEAIEGDEIEQIRFLKSHAEVGLFDCERKPLQWIYYHILSPSVNPEEDWTFEETVTRYVHANAKVPVLEKPNLIPFIETHEGFAWDHFR